MENSLHNIAGLSETARSAVEALIGHKLHNNDVLYITTLGIQSEPAPLEQKAAWDELESIIAETQRSSRASGLSPAEIDAVIDEELTAVRYGRGA